MNAPLSLSRAAPQLNLAAAASDLFQRKTPPPSLCLPQLLRLRRQRDRRQRKGRHPPAGGPRERRGGGRRRGREGGRGRLLGGRGRPFDEGRGRVPVPSRRQRRRSRLGSLLFFGEPARKPRRPDFRGGRREGEGVFEVPDLRRRRRRRRQRRRQQRQRRGATPKSAAAPEDARPLPLARQGLQGSRPRLVPRGGEGPGRRAGGQGVAGDDDDGDERGGSRAPRLLFCLRRLHSPRRRRRRRQGRRQGRRARRKRRRPRKQARPRRRP